MSEEQDNIQKPKTTLIKHRRPEAEVESEAKAPKKKVVVVKKKKPKPKVVVKAEPVETTKAAEDEPARKTGVHSIEDRERSESRKPTEAGGRPSSVRGRMGPLPQTSARRSAPPPRGESRSPERRPAGRPQRPTDRRPTGRPSFAKPGAGKGPPKPAPATETKPGAKKFYKSRKKTAPSWTKREQIKEKDFQLKKRQVIQKTNPVPKQIDIMEVITVSELAKKMNLKASDLISKLMSMGMMVTINQQIDAATAGLLAEEYGSKVNIVSLYDETLIESEADEKQELKTRPPIVTVMGHVDHGKTRLLDTIRKTDVASGEFGGITQHIGAYKVHLEEGDIVFLDTPGHEAFGLMRARGAQVTDIVVLVVAADDGVMPQTTEAIDHAREAGVPIIVAVNKIDLPNANPERVKQQLSEYNLIPEEWGGNTLFNEVSALDGTGVKELLESILLQTELLELTAPYDCRAEGRVVESKVEHGRGIVGSVLVLRGSLKVGDAFVAGVYPGKVRAMFDDKGEKIEIATPATPVEVLGFSGVPDAGAPFQVTETEKVARQIGSKRQELEKQGEAQNVKKITLDNLYDSIQEGEVLDLKVIIKGDVHGSVEALQSSLEKLSTPEIRLMVIRASAGAILEDDVNLASASNAIIVGFHVRPTPKAQELADREKVEIRKYNIIYDAVNDIRSAMEGMLSPEIKESIVGKIEVRDTFKVPRIGTIAGCYVTSGKITRNANIRVFRDGVEIHSGRISSLKRFKDDAREVESGFECGIGLENFPDIRVGDEIEVYELEEVAKKLTQEKASV
ncbi:MAG: translation initiation factor IF-2 [Spirochaetales bacterium]|nr:translation initiation factor IF-2 [Spirochaetales bacterium]